MLRKSNALYALAFFLSQLVYESALAQTTSLPAGHQVTSASGASGAVLNEAQEAAQSIGSSVGSGNVVQGRSISDISISSSPEKPGDMMSIPKIGGSYSGPGRTTRTVNGPSQSGRNDPTALGLASPAVSTYAGGAKVSSTADASLPNEFQKYVAEATGNQLPIFGNDFFSASNRYQPTQNIPVPGDYVLGPGDELLIRGWGAIDVDFRAVIDRDGLINMPKVGTVPLAGVRASAVEDVLRAAFGKVFRGFTLNVTFGQLRGITIYVVGQARRPGTYMVSSLSTLVTALFESGGPTANGSLRRIQVKRAGKVAGEMDLYAFLSNGDKSGDIKLADGDVVFIPPANGFVALVGTIERPGIYELRGDNDDVENLLKIAGGMPLIADPQRLIVEHIDPRQKLPRFIEELKLDVNSMKRSLSSGDLISVLPISQEYSNAVTVRAGNGRTFRMPFSPGMKVADLIPDKATLISRASVTRQNDLNHALGEQYDRFNWSYALIERLNRNNLTVSIIGFNLSRALAEREGNDNVALQPGDTLTVFQEDDVSALPVSPELANVVSVRSKSGRSFRVAYRQGMRVRDVIPDKATMLKRSQIAQRTSNARALGEQEVEFNWEYAVIERRSGSDSALHLIGFNLGFALAANDSPENVVLRPGDTITVFSIDELRTPIKARRVFVRIEGEVRQPGVYQVESGESLANVLLRAGGATQDAYMFGAEFYRESVRVSQQANLDKLILRLEQQAHSDAAKVAANISPYDAQGGASTAQIRMAAEAEARSGFVKRLRELKSSGRVSLGLPYRDTDWSNLINVGLENGDQLIIPNRPSTVQVVGAVNSESAYVWQAGRTISDYLALAGIDRNGDRANTFIMRANGTVSSNADRWITSIDGLDALPGDIIVVPERADKETAWTAFVRNAKDITQVLANFGLGAAAIHTLSK